MKPISTAGQYNMRLFATITACPERTEATNNNTSFAEISDEEEDGLHFLFYYNANKQILGDYCLLSLEDAMNQAHFDYGINKDDWKT